jgi:hypothetical protein
VGGTDLLYVGIVGEVTSPKITQKRDKNKHDQLSNTPISFKRGIKYKCTRGKKR